MWFAYSLAAAVLQAGQFAVVKGRARHVPPLVVIVWVQVFGVTAWMAYVLLGNARFAVPGGGWRWVLASVVLAAGMNYLLTRASASGDISIVGPVLALSPIFTILPDRVFSGALPAGLGWLGIALSVAGTITLSRGRTRGISPRALFRREDALCALGAAVLLGALAAVDRRAGLTLGVPSYLLATHGCTALVLGPVVVVRTPRALAATLAPGQLAVMLGHAALAVLGTAMQIVAATLAPAAYVNSVRRTSAVFAVLMGRALFDEPDVAGRLTGAALATAGVACLLLAG